MNDSLDLLCRKLLMSAFLYYHCDAQVWSDGEYDLASEKIAKHWAYVPIQYKVLLDPDATNEPSAIRATGFHFLYTERIESAATAWWYSKNPKVLLTKKIGNRKPLNMKELNSRIAMHRLMYA
jgi:hypothetical protein